MLQDANIISLLSKNPKNVLVGSISAPTADSSEVNLPVVLIKQIIVGNFDERDEVLFENNVLKMIQHVVIEDKVFTISNRECALINTTLTLLQSQFFLSLWKEQQILCVEYRLSIGKDANNVRHLFSIGGLWDNIGKSWVFEPHSKPKTFWDLTETNSF